MLKANPKYFRLFPTKILSAKFKMFYFHLNLYRYVSKFIFYYKTRVNFYKFWKAKNIQQIMLFKI